MSYPDLEAFCLFVGYPRSGHSLVGSLLDAHPDIAIAHEANAVKLVSVEGVGREALFEALLRNAAGQAERTGGRRASGYSYAVADQWQGRVRTLRVIGDKSGKKTASRLGGDETALETLARVVRLPLRLVHVVRNPYDIVARMALVRSSKGAGAEEAVHRSITVLDRLLAAADGLMRRGTFPMLTVEHEAFVRDPVNGLRSLCGFLGVDADPDYLAACASIVNPSPHETRRLVAWSERDLHRVAELIRRHDFLHRYDPPPVAET
ncbi:MAG TPA: sulfotransferase [Gaiellaceae bacterium]|nr:sulfotransferase [Gaiellaceae bacterium]